MLSQKQAELDALERIIFPHRYGFPVVASPEDLSQTLEMLHIRPWQPVRPGLSLAEYIKLSLTEKQIGELRFAPNPWVNVFHHPNGDVFTGFSSKGRSWATVVVPLDDPTFGTLIPFAAEFKHGREQIVLVPPSGVPNAQEKQQPDGFEACGRRELFEESGITLKEIHRLTHSDLPASARQTDQGVHLFLGLANDPTTWEKPNPDRTEFLRIVLIPLETFQKLVSEGTDPHIGIELSAVAGVLLAMRKYEALTR